MTSYAMQNAPVIEYITEEVRRQGHDVMALDGIERVGWMLNAWAYVMKLDSAPYTLVDVVAIGQLIEPIKNRGGLRRCAVRVGHRVCPDFREVKILLVGLLKNRNAMNPLEFYKEFELIHPFVDGNGRTGKILLNALNGTLHDPVFPPADLFGYPINNP